VETVTYVGRSIRGSSVNGGSADWARAALSRSSANWATGKCSTWNPASLGFIILRYRAKRNYVHIFSDSYGTDTDPGQAATQVVPTHAVTMSPILAKDLSKTLIRVIEGYERNTNATIPDIPMTPFSV
jgi:hypothetical protein